MLSSASRGTDTNVDMIPSHSEFAMNINVGYGLNFHSIESGLLHRKQGNLIKCYQYPWSKKYFPGCSPFAKAVANA